MSASNIVSPAYAALAVIAPKLPQYATHLVNLNIRRIPHSGYFSPEEMVTGLSGLTSLGSLIIGFESPPCRSRPDRRTQRPPPRIRTPLPVLTWFRFKGVCEYLDYLVAQIDAPLLDKLSITFFHQLITAMETLYIWSGLPRPNWQDDIENSHLQELFIPFTAVKDLYLSTEFTSRMAPALKELVGERVTEVFPALQTFFLEEPLLSGPAQETIEQFIAARQLADCPIAISRWEKEKGRFVA